MGILKIALVHNFYTTFGGEDAVVQNLIRMLEHQHSIITYFRSSREDTQSFAGKIASFLSGIYNPFEVIKFRKFLKTHKPDIIHIHNLYPFISPAILPVCRKENIPVVMTVHNYRLVCPNGLFFMRNQICEKCVNGKEWNCLLNNCEGSMVKSFGYALRNMIARYRRLYKDYISMYIALTEFQKSKLVANGFNSEKIVVLGNTRQESPVKVNSQGDYVAFIGRISPEKGIDLVFEAARKIPHITFKLAGSGSEKYLAKKPENVLFTGQLGGSALIDFIGNCRFGIMASLWYEGFSMAILDFISAGKPCIVPNLGGMPEIVGGEELLLYSKGNSNELREKVMLLWNDKNITSELGNKMHKRFINNYSENVFQNRLVNIYQQVIKNVPLSRHKDSNI